MGRMVEEEKRLEAEIKALVGRAGAVDEEEGRALWSGRSGRRDARGVEAAGGSFRGDPSGQGSFGGAPAGDGRCAGAQAGTGSQSEGRAGV